MRVPRFTLAAATAALLAGCFFPGTTPISPYAGSCGHDRAYELAPVIEAVTFTPASVPKGGTFQLAVKARRRDSEFRLVHLGYKWTEHGPSGEGITYNLGSEYEATTTWRPRTPGRARIALEVRGAYDSTAHLWATVAADGSATIDGPAVIDPPGRCEDPALNAWSPSTPGPSPAPTP